jgi:hypothetical protein
MCGVALFGYPAALGCNAPNQRNATSDIMHTHPACYYCVTTHLVKEVGFSQVLLVECLQCGHRNIQQHITP